MSFILKFYSDLPFIFLALHMKVPSSPVLLIILFVTSPQRTTQYVPPPSGLKGLLLWIFLEVCWFIPSSFKPPPFPKITRTFDLEVLIVRSFSSSQEPFRLVGMVLSVSPEYILLGYHLLGDFSARGAYYPSLQLQCQCETKFYTRQEVPPAGIHLVLTAARFIRHDIPPSFSINASFHFFPSSFTSCVTSRF